MPYAEQHTSALSPEAARDRGTGTLSSGPYVEEQHQNIPTIGASGFTAGGRLHPLLVCASPVSSPSTRQQTFS